MHALTCLVAEETDRVSTSLHLSSHLAPGTGTTVGGIHTVVTHSVLLEWGEKDITITTQYEFN